MDQHSGGPASHSASGQVAVKLQSPDHLLAELLSGDEARAEAAVKALVAAGESVVTGTAEPAALRRTRSPLVGSPGTRGVCETSDRVVPAGVEGPCCRSPGRWSAGSGRSPSIPAAAASLIRLLSDEDNVAAVMAVNALVKLGGEAVPQLLDEFEHAPRRGQIQILRTLSELRDPRAIRLMLSAQGQDSAAMQYWAQEGLERLGLNMVYLRPD